MRLQKHISQLFGCINQSEKLRWIFLFLSIFNSQFGENDLSVSLNLHFFLRKIFQTFWVFRIFPLQRSKFAELEYFSKNRTHSISIIQPTFIAWAWVFNDEKIVHEIHRYIYIFCKKCEITNKPSVEANNKLFCTFTLVQLYFISHMESHKYLRSRKLSHFVCCMSLALTKQFLTPKH